MIDVSRIEPEQLRPIRRSEYERMVEVGLFEDERLELLGGALVQMSPQGARHAEVIHRLAEVFFAKAGDRVRVRVQAPIALSDDSEPEPDLALVPAGDYSRGHPAIALLVVEVSDSTLRKDRGLKAELYAAAGIPEYWLVDIEANVVEVRSQPEGGRYSKVIEVSSGTLGPRLLPGVQVSVSELLA